MQPLELSLPEESSIWVQVVNEMNDSRPDLSCVVIIAIFCIFEEDIHLLAAKHGLSVVDGDSHIQKRDKVQLFVFDERVEFFGRVCVIVDGEDHLPVHVLKIRPEGVQRNVVFVVFSHHLLYLIERLVPPATLMEAETPERRNVSSADVFMVFL